VLCEQIFNFLHGGGEFHESRVNFSCVVHLQFFWVLILKPTTHRTRLGVSKQFLQTVTVELVGLDVVASSFQDLKLVCHILCFPNLAFLPKLFDPLFKQLDLLV
jgi:hypothetical protein